MPRITAEHELLVRGGQGRESRLGLPLGLAVIGLVHVAPDVKVGQLAEPRREPLTLGVCRPGGGRGRQPSPQLLGREVDRLLPEGRPDEVVDHPASAASAGTRRAADGEEEGRSSDPATQVSPP